MDPAKIPHAQVLPNDGQPGADGAPSAAFLTIAEVARVLRVDPKTIRREIDRGHLPAIRVGRVYRVPANAIERLAHLPASTAPPGGPAETAEPRTPQRRKMHRPPRSRTGHFARKATASEPPRTA